MKLSEDEIITNIIGLIRILNYDGLENYETLWVRSVLLEPGRSRTRLMMWVIDQVNPAEAVALQNASTEGHSKKCLEILSKMGLCRPTDSDVIEGSAPGIAQLKFWKLCFEAILKLRQLPPTRQLQAEESHQGDKALHCLAAAPHTAVTLRSGGISLLPADLMEGYKHHIKSTKKTPLYAPESLDNQLEAITRKLKELKNTKNTSLAPAREPTSEEYDRIQDSMFERLQSLGKEQQVFQNVFTSTIAPWISSDTHTELSRAGQLIHETPPKLQKVNELLHCMKNSSSQTKVLMDAVHPSVGGCYTSAITSTIQNLVDDHATPSCAQNKALLNGS